MRRKRFWVSRMNELQLTPEAVRDLAEIKRYIANDLGNPTAAIRVIGRITQNLRILQNHAEAGPSVEAITGNTTDLRMLVCDKYIAIYRINGKVVSVARIINARQDYMRVLFGEQE